MKILILATGYPRWKSDIGHVYLHRLAKSLVNLNIEVHVLAPHSAGLKKEERMEGVFVHRFQYLYPASLQTLAYFPGIPEKIRTWKGKIQLPFFVLSAACSMLRLIQKEKVNCINAHWATPFGLLAVATKRIHKTPVIVTLYGAELFPITGGRLRFLKQLTAFAINQADAVVGISDATCNAGMTVSGRKDIAILPDGIDTDTFNPSVKARKIKIRLGRFILTSGRMVERKGFIYLLRAMPFILSQFADVKLVIGGEGPQRAQLECEIRKLHLKENVVLPGFIDEKEFPKYLRGAEVFVLPAIIDRHGDTEGSATILLEAMACGTPIVGTKVGGIPYAIKDGIGGYLVRPKNPKQLADKICTILADRKLGRRLGLSGKRYVKGNFDWRLIATKYQKEFKRLSTSRSV